MKILVLVAHPDDEVIMCGATMDKLVKKGHNVYVTYFTHNDQAYFNKETSSQRQKRAALEAKKSSDLLGYTINFLPYVDMHITEHKGDAIKKTIAEIRKIKPDVIITHQDNDKHIDHRTVAEIVPEANFQSGCKLCGGKIQWSAKTVLQGEINLEMTMPFVPGVLSEVSQANVHRKLEAFFRYESVMDEHGTNATWLKEKLFSTAKLRGAAAEMNFAEGFIINNYMPLHSDGVKDLFTILST